MCELHVRRLKLAIISALEDIVDTRGRKYLNCMRLFVSRSARAAERPDGDIWNRSLNGLCMDFTL